MGGLIHTKKYTFFVFAKSDEFYYSDSIFV